MHQQHVEDELDHDFSRLGGRRTHTGLWSTSLTDAELSFATPAVARS